MKKISNENLIPQRMKDAMETMDSLKVIDSIQSLKRRKQIFDSIQKNKYFIDTTTNSVDDSIKQIKHIRIKRK